MWWYSLLMDQFLCLQDVRGLFASCRFALMTADALFEASRTKVGSLLDFTAAELSCNSSAPYCMHALHAERCFHTVLTVTLQGVPRKLLTEGTKSLDPDREFFVALR
jgi:hypothetical protein